MKNSLLSLLVVGLMACSPQGDAQDAKTPATDIDTTHLERMGFSIEQISPSSVDGLYEVITNEGLIYVADGGKKLVSGRIYDITGAQPENLSEQRLQAMRLNDLEQVKDSVIEFTAPDEEHVIWVFTDPTCGYCRQLHENRANYLAEGITIRYLGWPRTGLQGTAFNQLQQVWCAADPATAMTAVKQDQPVRSGACDDPVAEHFALGKKFGVRGTPAIVLESGRLLPGLLPPQKLLEEIEK
ncbi:bifunctional protein-disulfide isomerase/oxidoreductase DsbC [Pseudidiomarina salinarum]|nr:bifunctional protein-disulfide isomerase/oxidoreductase DsbC [Pseudidiomarina salinarum]RUO70507.1 bifunctional protein-disulfide isomerase/oxidoreductase DsbC [Pseudidiomarina salinarum]